LLLSLGQYTKGEATALVASFLSNFGSFSYVRSYDWPLLAGKLILALPSTSPEKSELLLNVLKDPQVSLLAKKALFSAFVDDPALSPLFDPAFLNYNQANPSEGKKILAEAHYHEFHADYLSPGMLLLFLKEDVYLPTSINLASRLPALNEQSTPEEISTYTAILHYLIQEDRLTEIPANALPLLSEIGEAKEAADLAQAMFEKSPSLDAYLFFRPYLGKGQVASRFYALKEAGKLVSCLDAILLYENGNEGLGEPNLEKISCYDYYLCREKIPARLLPEIVVTLEHRFTSANKAKLYHDEWTYGLLFLEAMGQLDLLKSLLRNPLLGEESHQDDNLRATYLSSLLKAGLLSEKGYELYPEVNHVTH
jgi:hypothetical protein